MNRLTSKASSQAHIYLFLVALIYGANYSVAKIIMDPGLLDPTTFIFLRIGSAALLFLVFYGPLRRKVLQDWREMVLASITGVVANQFLFFNGLARTTPMHAALIMITTPILVLVIQSMTHSFSISLKQWSGTLIGFAGTALLIWSTAPDFSASDDTLTGDLMVFANACSYAVYLTRIPLLLRRHQAMEVLPWIFLTGLLISLPAGVTRLDRIEWQAFDMTSLLALAFVLICTTFLAYLFNARAMEISGPGLVSQYIFLQPVLALVIALIAGKDQLRWEYAVFGLLTVCGVKMAVDSRNPEG